jgi:hypothetical protein
MMVCASHAVQYTAMWKKEVPPHYNMSLSMYLLQYLTAMNRIRIFLVLNYTVSKLIFMFLTQRLRWQWPSDLIVEREEEE